jgi:hypothetical protein
MRLMNKAGWRIQPVEFVPMDHISIALVVTVLACASCNKGRETTTKPPPPPQPAVESTEARERPPAPSDVASVPTGVPDAACVEGMTRCREGVYEMCVRGSYGTTGIRDGACGAECTPGSSRCRGIVPQSCSKAGHWKNGHPCNRSQVCRNGFCERWRPMMHPPAATPEEKADWPGFPGL